jgi:hypothetical protein
MAYPTKKRQPQDPGSHCEPGAPSVALYFPEKCCSDILSTILMPTNKNFPKSGPPASGGSACKLTFRRCHCSRRSSRHKRFRSSPKEFDRGNFQWEVRRWFEWYGPARRSGSKEKIYFERERRAKTAIEWQMCDVRAGDDEGNTLHQGIKTCGHRGAGRT